MKNGVGSARGRTREVNAIRGIPFFPRGEVRMSLSNVARLMPRRIAAQMALLVAVSLVVAHVVAFTTFYLLWRPTPAEIPFVKIAELAYTAKLLDAASSGEIRAQIVEAATRSFPDLRYSAHSPPIGTDPAPRQRG